MIKSIKNNKSIAILLLGIAVVVEIGILIYCNLINTHGAIDQDYAQLLYHAIQMGDKGEFLLKDWVYTTTGEFDCPMLLAVFFYKVTGNIYISYGLSNVVNMLVWIFTLNMLFDNMNARLETKLLALGLLFITYDFSTLAYSNMMFIRGSQYSIKALVPLMLITAITMPVEKIKTKLGILLYIILYFELFMTAFSSGIFVFVCGISPVIVCLIVLDLIENKVNKVHLIHSCLSVILSIIGLLLCRIVDIPIKSDGFLVNHDIPFTEGFVKTVNSFFSTFNMYPQNPVEAGSLQSGAIVLRWIIVVVIVSGLLLLPQAFGIKLYGKADSKIDGATMVETMLISVFAFNFVLLLIIPARDRYMLIGTAAIMICAAIMVGKWLEESSELLRIIAYSAIALLIIINSCFSVAYDLSAWLRGEKSQYQVNFDRENEIANILDENNVNLAYVYNEEQIRAGLLLVDSDRKYVSFYPSGIVDGWDIYDSWKDNTSAERKNAIIVRNYENMQEYITDNYELVGTVDDYDVLVSDHNPVDGLSVIKKDFRTVDLPTTYGYEVNGSIDADGYLHSAETGNLLVSPGIHAKSSFDYEINYECDEEQSSRVDIYCNGEYMQSLDLNPTERKAVVHLDGPGEYMFIVFKDGTGKIVLKEMYFQGR